MSLLSRDFDETAQAQQESVGQMLLRQGALWLQISLLILLSVFPIPFLSFAEVRPVFLPMAVYYWTVFSPYRLSPLTTFLAGLLMDLLNAGPVGLGAVSLLLVQRGTASQRKFLVSQPFLVLWLGFCLVAAGMSAMQWAVLSLFSWELVPPKPAIFGALLTGAFFPPVAWLLGVFGRAGGRGRGG